jgi:hypothetical protein
MGTTYATFVSGLCPTRLPEASVPPADRPSLSTAAPVDERALIGCLGGEPV